MSIEFSDKEVSTEDLLDAENVEKEEGKEQNSKEKEKKERTDLEKLEAVLSVLVENKVTSIRNCGKKVKEKKTFFNKFRNKMEEEVECARNGGKSRGIRASSSAISISACKCGCHRTGSRLHDFLSPERFPGCPRTSLESSHQSNPLFPERFFGESYDSASAFCKPAESLCSGLDGKSARVQKCLPKHLTTEQWLNSTSGQTSTETATTSSGYISPTFGTETKKNRSGSTELAIGNGECETIIEMSKIQAQKTLDAIEECKSIEDDVENRPEIIENDPTRMKYGGFEHCRDDTCGGYLPQCLSAACLPTCRYSMMECHACHNVAPNKHLHPSGGHYMSCCNSPTTSFRRFQYDENYLALAMNLEDLEFEQEEERRKRRKKRKKRRKERQIRARGLMADELKNAKKAAKVLDPEDLPKRARWTIVATACLLLLMSMLLVGVTLRMAPIIDEMVRKENEEMLHSLSRQGPVKEATNALNATKNSNSPLGNSSNRL